MGKIIPRWEFRTWDKELKLSIDLSKFEHTRHVESSEVYILSTECDENTKVRDNKLDIKQLQQIDENGFELWKPIKKVEFPLPKDELLDLYKIWKVDSKELNKDIYTFEEFLNIAKSNDKLLIFNVSKIRDLYDVDGCIVEYSKVTVNGKTYITAAAELPDTSIIKKVVKKMGLWGRENISYVKALKKIEKGEL